MTHIACGVIGATGYAGAELVRLLHQHPHAHLAALSSKRFAGQALSSVYPAYLHQIDTILTTQEDVIAQSDVVFASLPHGLCEPIAQACVQKGTLLIDLGADFRLHDEADYEQWYHLRYQQPALHRQAAYGLPELFREQIAHSPIIGNPGCYPTSIALGLAPALQAHCIEVDTLVLDSKSGVTGAGRGLTQNTHFPDCNESFTAYKAGVHRHTPEIEQTLSQLAGQPVQVTFVPHLLPINRGILSTMYARLSAPLSLEQIHALYADYYAAEPFVRVLPLGSFANVHCVQYANYCDISLHMDARTQRLIVTSAIDNMVKGAAGQAIQNMNLCKGLPETTGLVCVPPAF